MNQIFLSGQEINLKTFSLEDVDKAYIDWFNDEEVCQFNAHHVFPYNQLKAEEYLKKLMTSENDLVLSIIHKSDNTHIGNIALQNINFIHHNAEFAIILGEKDYWQKGYAKEAAKMIIDHGFKSMNLHRIYCGTSVKNIGMQKLATHLGMKEEGRRKEALYKDGQYVDIVEYGVLKDVFYNN